MPDSLHEARRMAGLDPGRVRAVLTAQFTRSVYDPKRTTQDHKLLLIDGMSAARSTSKYISNPLAHSNALLAD